MKQLTEEKVRDLYTKFKLKARDAYNKRQYNSSLKYLKATAGIGYSFYLGYKDDELERILESMSSFVGKKTDNKERFEDECVFYDSFSVDNGGLVQQYLMAIMNCGYKIRYIAERDAVLSETSEIGKLLRGYSRSEIIIIPDNLKPFKKTQFIYDKIIETKASRLFIQSHPYAASAVCAFYALPSSIKKYKIDLTDHTFWIGTRFVDYTFEFRSFGCVAAIEKRGFKEKQVLYLPFYPIMQRQAFVGFPKEAEGKVILFSGGSYYKIFDVNDTFFIISKALLDACPNVVLLFAGSGDRKLLNEKIEQYNLSGRFIPIGQRFDISEVFDHCDIYLNTYPFGGGLMSQYAAQKGKPIVNYHTPTTALVEEFVCQIKQIPLSDDSLEELVKRVKCLVDNPVYRCEYGKEIQSCVVSPALFNQFFFHCMNSGTNPLSYKRNVSFEEHKMNIYDKLKYEESSMDFHVFLTKLLGVSSIWQCPDIAFSTAVSLIKKNRLKNIIKNRIKRKLLIFEQIDRNTK